LSFFKNITSKELYKVTTLNSVSVIIKIGIGFISSKIIAVFIGPTGMALVGNLRNFITSVESMGTLGFQNGIVKYVAEYEKEEHKLKKLLSTIIICLIIATLLLSGFLFFFAHYLNDEIFGGSYQFKVIFKAFAISLPWYIASLFLISILNGLGKFKEVIRINIFGNSIGLILSFVLIYKYQTFGALLAVILAPSMLFFITLFYFNSKTSFLKLFSRNHFDVSILKNLSEYSLMALVSAVVGPIIFILIRNNIIAKLGYEKAGYWEAMTRISSYYLLFLTTILTVYFLPKLSKSENYQQTKTIFWSYFKHIIPFFILVLIMLFFVKDNLISILFTKEFLPVTTLFFWQLLGDIFKSISLILGYQFFAKKLTIAFIVTELFSLSILYFSSIYLISIYGIQGIVMAHALTYFVYVLVLGIYFRKSLF